MSGLVAFTGPPDRDLALRMMQQLSHRGGLVDHVVETPAGTILAVEWSTRDDAFHNAGRVAEPSQRTHLGLVRSGIYRTEHCVWALSGFAWSALPNLATPQSLRGLRGSFAVACLSDNQLAIARDAVGCQSLYYGRAGSRWLVATEPKAITSEASFAKRLRPSAIAQYLAFSFVPGSGTMLENLYEAEAGHLVHLCNGDEPRVERYFQFEDDEYSPEQDDADDDKWILQTRQCLEQAVAERLTHSEAAIFLSGGLDSSIVAAEVARQSSRPVRTFSIHFGTKYPNELSFARAVAERIGSRHEEVLIEPKRFLPRLRQMVWHLDEPIGDPITQPNFELAAHVSASHDCVWNGEGGDPLFGGPKNLPMMLLHWYGDAERPINFREQAYLASYRRAYEEWTRLLSNDLKQHIDPTRDLEQILQPFFSSVRPRSFLNKLMAINIRLKGANLILPKVDRMLAAHRLTPLSPLFDDQLTRLSFRMPPTMKLRHGIEKYVLKRAYENDLPREVIERPKSGMRVPVHYWFRKELRRYAASILSKRDIQQAGIFNHERVAQLLRYETEEGPGRYGLRLWMLLTFEIWRRIVVEGEAV
ncbi:MAG: asparagine synthase-related protein [Pirellulaceae bacterium]